MSLEMLPDELLLLICSYLSAFDVLQAFNDLNVRLNGAISEYRNHIDLTRVRYGQFNQYCDMLLRSSLGLQVQSLKLSNNKPVMRQIKFFAKQVWPLDQKLPNLECLTLLGITYDELDLFLPKIVLLKKLTELNIEGIIGFYKESFNTGLIRKPTKQFSSGERFSLPRVSLSPMLILDWVDHTVTHLTVYLQTTADLIKLIHGFRNLQFLNVIISGYQVVDPNECHDIIPVPQLKEFRMKILCARGLLTFEEFACLLINMPNLQSFKYEMKLDIEEDNINKVAYLNGQKWHEIRVQLHHLVDFDCLICIECSQLKSCYSGQNIRSQIVDLFSDFPDWSVTVRKSDSNYTCIYVYTKTLRVPYEEIEHKTLGQLNGYEITALVDGVSKLNIEAGYYKNDNDNKYPTEFPTLVLPDHIFPNLHCVCVGGCDFIFHNELLTSFLEQLFWRAPNIDSIIIRSSGDGNGPGDIDYILSCFEKPSMSVKDCKFDVKGTYDKSVMELMIFYLPKLTSLTITIIYDTEDVITIVNTCLTHLKHFIYLELEEPRYGPWSRSERCSHEMATESDRHLWLKENTILGSSMMERAFYAEFDFDWKIWF